MKQLKSSLGDLRHLFARVISLRDIAEPLVSFDCSQPVEVVRPLMERRHFDVVGVREQGIVTGFAALEDLHDGVLRDARQPFRRGEVFSDAEPLVTSFAALRERRHLFINVLGQVGGIVTRGDLQKAPVRLWLFGLLSLLEMQMLRVVRERYPEDSWTRLLTSERVDGARKLHHERLRRNEGSDLPDCLQLGDKGAIILKDKVLFDLTGFESKRALETFFKDAGMLRNALAHANDILRGQWPDLADLVARLESLLERLEAAVITPAAVRLPKD